MLIKKRGLFTVIMVVLFAVSILAILWTTGLLRVPENGGADSAPVTDGTAALELFIEGLPQELSAGHSAACGLRTEPDGAGTEPVWSSSDDSVVSVDNGTVTAHREGSAEITVYDARGGASASASVNVKDDSLNETKAALAALAVSCTDASLADAVTEQREILSRCSSEQAAEASAALGRFLDLALDGKKCDIGELASFFDISADGLRIAAQTVMLREQQNKGGVTLSFTGDCSFGMLNETDTPNRFPAIYSASGSVTYPFDRVKHIFFMDDMTVINFEGTLIKKKGAPEVQKNYHIRGEPEYTAILTGSSVETANLANNHSSDYGSAGFESTDRLLRDSGVRTMYDGSPVIENINGIETVLLSAGDKIQPLNFTDEIESVSAGIKRYKKKDNIVIVNLHWGDEYVVKPTDAQIAAAHRLIDEGADMIVGHHAHIIQGIELYNGKVIAYGLGNFSFCGKSFLEETETFILRASFGAGEDGATYMREWSVIPCSATGTGSDANDFRPVPLFGKDAEHMISFLEARCAMIGNSQPVPYFRCD